VESAKFTVVQ